MSFMHTFHLANRIIAIVLPSSLHIIQSVSLANRFMQTVYLLLNSIYRPAVQLFWPFCLDLADGLHARRWKVIPFGFA